MKHLFLVAITILMVQCARDQRRHAAVNYPQPLPDSAALPFPALSLDVTLKATPPKKILTCRKNST